MAENKLNRTVVSYAQSFNGSLSHMNTTFGDKKLEVPSTHDDHCHSTLLIVCCPQQNQDQHNMDKEVSHRQPMKHKDTGWAEGGGGGGGGGGRRRRRGGEEEEGREEEGREEEGREEEEGKGGGGGGGRRRRGREEEEEGEGGGGGEEGGLQVLLCMSIKRAY